MSLKLISNISLNSLKRRAYVNKRKISKIFCTKNKKCKNIENIVFAKRSHKFRIFKIYENCSISYHIIRGSINLYIYDKKKFIIEVIKLNSNVSKGALVFRFSDEQFFLRPKVISKFCYFHEITSLPKYKKQYKKFIRY